jgi:hypothetical protein
MSATASLYLWRYKKAKENLEEKCGEEVFVPDLVPVRRKGDSRVGRAFTYTQGLMPESEWVFIVGAKKGFFRAKEKQEVAVISAETFRELPLGYIQPFQWPDPGVRIIGLNPPKEWAKSFSQLTAQCRGPSSTSLAQTPLWTLSYPTASDRSDFDLKFRSPKEDARSAVRRRGVMYVSCEL